MSRELQERKMEKKMEEALRKRIELTKQAMIDLLVDEELTTAIARFTWNLYTNLQAQGFSKELAYELTSQITKQGFPTGGLEA